MASLLDETVTWAEFGQRHLDRRISKALTDSLGLRRPTLVQSRGIPVALEGKDLLCRARTGSGKTLCYAVPLVQRLLAEAEAKGAAPPLGGLVLVPTKELIVQVHGVITSLLAFCFDVLTVEPLLSGQKYTKAELPAMLVTTPSSLLTLVKLRRGSMQPLVQTLRMLVIDEADLMFSFGYEDDMRALCGLMPATYQPMLVSATLSEEVEQLKGLMLHKPVTLKLEEPQVTGKLSQFYLVCHKSDKYLILYTLLKLQLVQGKILIFVKSIEAAYRMKIFLERFSINSAVLNAELPHSTRQNIMQAFNQSLMELLIATDGGFGDGLADNGEAGDVLKQTTKEDREEEQKDEEEQQQHLEMQEEKQLAKRGTKRKRRAESKAATAAAGVGEKVGKKEAIAESPTKIDGKAKKSAPAEKATTGALAEAREESAPEREKAKRRKLKGKAAKAKEAGEEDQEDQANSAAAGPLAVGAVTVEVRKASPEVAVGSETRQFGRHRRPEADGQYSLTRGVDLQGVTTVINADVPSTVRDYVHRVGRCARGGASGTALTLCNTEEEEPVLQRIIRAQMASGAREVKPLPMQISDAERFRYRVEDMAKGLTKKVVAQYRTRELQLEALNSEKLKEYFEEHPDDKQMLQRTQRQLRERKSVRQHLRTVPSYLVPEQFVAQTPVQHAVREQAAARGVGGQAGSAAKRRRALRSRAQDPLHGSLPPQGTPEKMPHLTREAMLAKDRRIDPKTANVEDLPPISGRKLWKLRHKKHVKRRTDPVGERKRKTPGQKKRQKKFGF